MDVTGVHNGTFSHSLFSDKDASLWAVHDCIGGGGQGNVYAASKMVVGSIDQKYAIKVVKEEATGIWAKFVERELILFRKCLKHPNLCTPVNYFEVQSSLHCIILEALDFTLERVIHDAAFTFSGLVVLNHIIRGMCHLHDHEIMHRDLKTSNVMFNRRGVAIIIDFGWAIDVSNDNNDNNASTGVELKPWTLWYRPPEVALRIEVGCDIWYGKSADLWPIGLIGLEMLWQRAVFPCKGDSEAELIGLMRSLFNLRSLTWKNLAGTKQPPNLVDSVFSKATVPMPSRELASISCSLLTIDPSKRSAPPVDFVDEGVLVEFKRRC